MTVVPPDNAAIQRLRNDVALQLARYAHRMGLTQIAAAKRLGLPQPTLSKIINGRVSRRAPVLCNRVWSRFKASLVKHACEPPKAHESDECTQLD